MVRARWDELRHWEAVPAGAFSGDDGDRANAFRDAVDAYLAGLGRFASAALLGVSWGPRAIHEALLDANPGARLELPDEAGLDPVCHLERPLPALPAGPVPASVLIEIESRAREALRNVGPSAPFWHEHGQWLFDWERWADSWGLDDRAIRRGQDAFEDFALRHVPPGGPPMERLRSSRACSWEGARRAVERKLCREGDPLTPRDRARAREARRLLIAAVRGGHGSYRLVDSDGRVALPSDAPASGSGDGASPGKYIGMPTDPASFPAAMRASLPVKIVAIRPTDPYEDGRFVATLKDIYQSAFPAARQRGFATPQRPTPTQEEAEETLRSLRRRYGRRSSTGAA